ncbi:MAG: PAS domain S-box protein, partial [Rhodospirillales bacterium]|nr:PAS domain S-box protein [Rhodospirillales bacterium]
IQASHGKVLGTFGMYCSLPHKPDAAEIELIESSADLASIAIERHQTDMAIRESEGKYRALFDTSQDGIAFLTSSDGAIETANQAFLNMLGYGNEKIKGLRFQDRTPEKLLTRERELVDQQLAEKGFTDEFEKEYLRKDGTKVPATVRLWKVPGREGDGSYTRL